MFKVVYFNEILTFIVPVTSTLLFSPPSVGEGIVMVFLILIID